MVATAGVFVFAAIELREPVFLIFGLIAAAAATGVGFWARSNARKHRRMAETRTSQIASVGRGFAEVKGRSAPAGPPLESPLTKTACIYFRFLVEEHVNRGKRSYWRTVVDDRRDAGLLVFDGTGKARVRLDEAELVLAPDAHARSGVFKDAPADLEATLRDRYAVSTKGWIFNKALRYTETVLCEGEEIYVLGTAERTPDGQLEFRRGNDLFLVSDKSEEELSARFARNKWTGAVVGPILAAGGLALIANAFVIF